MFVVSVVTIALMTFALAGLALGFGTLFPQFETENAAQIPTSFGGLVFMMSAIALIGVVVVLEARPVYSVPLGSRRSARRGRSRSRWWSGFGLAASGVRRRHCRFRSPSPLRRLERLERRSRFVSAL